MSIRERVRKMMQDLRVGGSVQGGRWGRSEKRKGKRGKVRKDGKEER